VVKIERTFQKGRRIGPIKIYPKLQSVAAKALQVIQVLRECGFSDYEGVGVFYEVVLPDGTTKHMDDYEVEGTRMGFSYGKDLVTSENANKLYKEFLEKQGIKTPTEESLIEFLRAQGITPKYDQKKASVESVVNVLIDLKKSGTKIRKSMNFGFDAIDSESGFFLETEQREGNIKGITRIENFDIFNYDDNTVGRGKLSFSLTSESPEEQERIDEVFKKLTSLQ